MIAREYEYVYVQYRFFWYICMNISLCLATFALLFFQEPAAGLSAHYHVFSVVDGHLWRVHARPKAKKTGSISGGQIRKGYRCGTARAKSVENLTFLFFGPPVARASASGGVFRTHSRGEEQRREKQGSNSAGEEIPNRRWCVFSSN